ncbi:MAG: ATP-binding protein [Proteobacteria bacterium]|nr:ATP-binding protein [Pseudomonadota bacterium]
MSLFRQEFAIKGMDFIHAGEASIRVKNILKEIGAHQDLIRRVAIAAYEAEINTVIYGQGGVMILELDEDGVLIRVEDKGPGIPDLKLAMQEGWSTATPEIQAMGFGAGMGLPNIKKNSDKFVIDSEIGQGTRLKIFFNSGWKGRKT